MAIVVVLHVAESLSGSRTHAPSSSPALIASSSWIQLRMRAVGIRVEASRLNLQPMPARWASERMDAAPVLPAPPSNRRVAGQVSDRACSVDTMEADTPRDVELLNSFDITVLARQRRSHKADERHRHILHVDR